MPDNAAFSQHVEEQFIRWASANPDIRAAIVVGSRARLDHPADEWSDLDILLFAHNVERYQSSPDWIEGLAPAWMVIQGRTVMNDPEQLALFAGGFQCDFVFHPAEVLQGVKDMLARNQLPPIIARGARVILDKDSAIPELPPPARPGPTQPPSLVEFEKAVNQFWFQAVYAARQLRRGEMIPFKAADNHLKWQCIGLLEWQAHCLKGWETDTWHAGRFLAEWADPRDLAELQRSYASCDSEETWQAFLVLIDLYQRLALEVAARLGCPPRAAWMAEIHAYLQRLYRER